MRKLASIQKVLATRPIPGADLIEAVDVLGWTVVTQKSFNLKPGDLVIYFEIDSWLDSSEPRFASFEERFIDWNGKRGMRLKTIKLRKQVSQGLILPMSEFPEVKGLKEGDDATELLKIIKWESVEELNSVSLGNKNYVTSAPYPEFIFKTDQERVQNCGSSLTKHLDDTFEKSIKLDGSSMTVYHLNRESLYFRDVVDAQEKRQIRKLGRIGRLWHKIKKKLGLVVAPNFINGVCSRNIQLDPTASNHFSQYVRVHGLFDTLENYGKNIALQGELIGPSIQGNYEKTKDYEFYVFDVFDIDSQSYYLPKDARDLVEYLGLNYVPVLDVNFNLAQGFNAQYNEVDVMSVEYIDGEVFRKPTGEKATVLDVRDMTDKILADAEGPGMNDGVKREGIVYKSNTTPFSFKAISNSYLLKKVD